MSKLNKDNFGVGFSKSRDSKKYREAIGEKMSEKITPQFMLWCGEVRRLFELYIDGFYECYKDHPDVVETLIKNVKEKFDDFTFGKIQILALEEPIKVDMYIDYTDEILKEILAELVEDIKLKRSIEIQRSKNE